MRAKICLVFALAIFSRISLATAYICSGDYTVKLNNGETRGGYFVDKYTIDYQGGREAVISTKAADVTMETKIENVSVSGSIISGAKSQVDASDSDKFIRIQFVFDRQAMTAQINFDIGRAGKAYETSFSGECR
jgi:hypothetical protein